MALKLNDYKCEACQEVSEQLEDTSNKEQVLRCTYCNSDKLVKIISAGTGNKTHVSWSKWRV